MLVVRLTFKKIGKSKYRSSDRVTVHITRIIPLTPTLSTRLAVKSLLHIYKAPRHIFIALYVVLESITDGSVSLSTVVTYKFSSKEQRSSYIFTSIKIYL